MNRLNSIALLAGGALVAVAATGCASNSPKPTASGPASTTTAAPSAGTPSAPGGAPSSAAGGASSSAPAGGSSTAPNADASSSPAPAGGTTAPAAAPVDHPVCKNADLNVSLAPAVDGQKSSVFVIAVKNVGPTCTVGPIPYVWITKSPTDASDETRPLIPSVEPGKKNIILTGTTVYSAIDLLPDSLATTTGTYGDLAVTANPSPDTTGKDVQDVVLPGSMAEGGAKLGVYANNPSLAISQIQYATTPEQ